MEQRTIIFILFFGWFVVSQIVQVRRTFHAPRCPKDTSTNCFRPMFAKGEAIDVYVYLTTDRTLRWWTKAGFKTLSQVPLWNTSRLGYGEPVDPVRGGVSVPLSHPLLQGVRKNQTMLYAHCFLVRSGSALEDSLREQDKAPQRGTLDPNVLHTKSHLTRLLPQVSKPRRSLLGESNSTENDSRVALPIIGHFYPQDALMWVGSSFVVSAFLEPSLPAAAVRGGLASAIAPLVMQAQEQKKETARKNALEFKLWNSEPNPPVPHIVPKIQLNLAADFEAYDARYPPPLLYQELSPQPKDVRYQFWGKKDKRYVPPFALDHTGLRQRYWRPLSEDANTTDPLLELELEVTGMVKYSVSQTIKQAMEMYMQMGIKEKDLEEIQDVVFRHPLHIMIIMQVIGVLQMALTTLAFKNDISFFKGRSDYTGLSSRSLATDTLQEIIIFLYLWDFDEISQYILIQVGISAAISAWKYARVARLGLYWSYMLPWVSYNRGAEGVEQGTEEIDARGMKYLKCVLYPLSAVWGLYNLKHYAYKSWWSWLISSMADFAYTFGFINMMPQIFINWKLKSVAHMPWRVLMYKFFHTFIDDVFAFFIMSDRMSQKHRIMTLRDDVVFFIFLYQRHIYKVDPTRPDEFGFVYTDATQQSLEEVHDKSPENKSPEELQDKRPTESEEPEKREKETEEEVAAQPKIELKENETEKDEGEKSASPVEVEAASPKHADSDQPEGEPGT